MHQTICKHIYCSSKIISNQIIPNNALGDLHTYYLLVLLLLYYHHCPMHQRLDQTSQLILVRAVHLLLLTTDMAADNEQLRSIKLNAAAQSLTQKHTHPKVILKKILTHIGPTPTQWIFQKNFSF